MKTAKQLSLSRCHHALGQLEGVAMGLESIGDDIDRVGAAAAIRASVEVLREGIMEADATHGQEPRA